MRCRCGRRAARPRDQDFVRDQGLGPRFGSFALTMELGGGGLQAQSLRQA